VRDVGFEVRRGEVLGLAGLVGSGRTETLRALFGADPPDAGRVVVEGRAGSATLRSPGDAVAAGLGLVPEDRVRDGLLMPLAIRPNATLASLALLTGRLGWIRAQVERAASDRLCEALQVQRASIEQPVAQLSGGNQQKVLMGRWLMRDCDVLLLDEPTRGIDVGARQTIYGLLDDLAARGKALVVVSSEPRELMAICDRIAVLSAGRIAATFARGEWTEASIMHAAFSGYLDAAAPAR
jgi:ribose transport system ATP-binding protein